MRHSFSRHFEAEVYNGVSHERWTDHPRIMPLTEADKAGHKAMIAWALSRRCEPRADPLEVIRRILAQYLFKLAVQDLKSTLLDYLRENQRQALRGLASWAVGKLGREGMLSPLGESPEEFLRLADPLHEDGSRVARLVRRASAMANLHEFETIIQPVEARRDHVEDVRAALGQKAAGPFGRDLEPFVSITGSLRFQGRWPGQVMLPRPSVLAHSFCTAVFAWAGAVGQEDVFWGGLFHDLPEAFTRDVGAPVKRATPDFPEAIVRAEESMIERALRPAMPESLWSELHGFMRVKEGALGREAAEAVDHADLLSAYVEASFAAHNGIASPGHRECIEKLEDRFGEGQDGPRPG